MSSLRPLMVTLCLLSSTFWSQQGLPQPPTNPQILQPVVTPSPVVVPTPSLNVPALRSEIRRLRLEMLDVLDDLEDLERLLEANPTPLPFVPAPSPPPLPPSPPPLPVPSPSPTDPSEEAEEDPGLAPAPAPAPAPATPISQDQIPDQFADPSISADRAPDGSSALASQSEAPADLATDPTTEPLSALALEATPETPEPSPSPALEEITALQVGTQTFSLPGDVLFDFDESDIRPEAALLLQEVAEGIIELSRARIIVEGHTDDVGDEAYNQALSLARANAVKNYLIRLIPNQENYSWLTKGVGSSQPIASNTTSEGRQLNRRVDLIIAP